jgi:hypothetical protein
VLVTAAVVVLTQNGVPVYAIVAAGTAVIVIGLVAVTTHPPTVTVLVTVYVPTVLFVKLIWPVVALTKDKPAVEVNTPAAPPPLKVGNGLLPFLQIGLWV